MSQKPTQSKIMTSAASKKIDAFKSDFMDDQKSLRVLHFQNNRWQSLKNIKIQHYLQGGQDLGGGNSFEAEFKALGSIILQNLKGYSTIDLGIDLDKLEAAVKDVKIIATKDRIFLNGSERDAINSRALKAIVLVESRWQRLDVFQKRILVLHEYLRFCDVNDSKYSISSKLATIQKLTLIPPAIENIYHQIDLPQDIWTSYPEGTLTTAFIDKEKDSVRIGFSENPGLVGIPFLTVVVADPVVAGKHVFYGTQWDDSLFSPSEVQKAHQCFEKLRNHRPITTIIVGERDMTIVDCWGPDRNE